MKIDVLEEDKQFVITFSDNMHKVIRRISKKDLKKSVDPQARFANELQIVINTWEDNYYPISRWVVQQITEAAFATPSDGPRDDDGILPDHEGSKES